MDALSSAPHPRSYDIPKPEEDLAEWTTKIKALQRQVDADDEAEQRRLEEEITAARRARLRRSRGEGITNGSCTSSPSPSACTQTDVGKRVHQMETLKHPANAGYNGHGATFDAEKKSFSQNYMTQSVRKSEPMSLAAFIGGRATGPRLNKHAAQQDVTDPRQFEQPPHTTLPHPVFGRNGIAMSGLVVQRPSAVRNKEVSSTGVLSRPSSDIESHAYLPEKIHVGRLSEHPAGFKKTEDEENKENHVFQKTGEKTVAFISQRTGNEEKSSVLQREGISERLLFPSMADERGRTLPHQRTGSRERALSTPVGFTTAKGAVRPSSRASERNETKYRDVQVGMPFRDRFKQSSTFQSETTSRPSAASPASQKLPPTPSYLARPVQPQPRPLSKQAMASYHVPSPAFAKPPAPKELTPSISRLQGRGFVQSIVNISSQLESSAVAPPSPPSKPRTTRKSSVLDRWQPQMAASLSTPPPPASPAPTKPVKAHPFIPDTSSTIPVKQLRTRASLPSISQGITNGAELERNTSLLKRMPPGGAPGLGSATTMAIYKPSASPIESEFIHVDELGIRVQTVSSCTEDPQRMHTFGGLPPPSGKPLSHPTKDRARKPRKVMKAQGAYQERENEATENVQDQPPMNNPSTSQISTATSGQEDAQSLSVPDTLTKHPGNAVKPSSATLGNVAFRCTGHTQITVSSVPPPPIPQDETKQVVHLGRALPGMTPHHKATVPAVVVSRPKLSSSLSRGREDNKPAYAAMRHTRSPSNGSRPTVMDVAFALSQQAEAQIKPEQGLHLQEGKDQNLVKTQAITHETKAEGRKSTLDKYSSTMLPALKEEATPASTPNSTLSRHAHLCNKVNTLNGKTAETFTRSPTRMDSTGYKDELPPIDVDQLLITRPNNEISNSSNQTISVDVLSIVGLTTVAISENSHIFYDTELLAIIYRSKSKVDGLVSTTLWIWCGKHSQVGDKEQRKVQDLARRYGTSATSIRQCSEPSKLVYLLGGVLAIRQGSRSRWSSENTAMHLIRENGGVIYIDEFDLSAKNLCSAFSYCISILNTVYVWYGCGSTQAERRAALQYAQSCTLDGQQPVELHEGEDDIDEVFWMLLGGQDYAMADHWKWRKEAPVTDPVVWRVRAGQGDQAVTPLTSWSSESNVQEEIYILNCVWEFFVLVGSCARGRKQDIRLSLDVAQTMSKTLSPHRPFPPTVHVLVLPSKLPLDMRHNFRDLDEEIINDGDVPEHMNILSFAEASESLQNVAWA